MAGNTRNKTIRLEDELWEELKVSAAELGSDASSVIREAVRWHLRLPGSRQPQRRLESSGS